MRKIGLLLATVILVVSCGKKTEIKGVVKNAENKKVAITGNISPVKVYDTVRLKADGKFSLQYEFTDDMPVFLVFVADKPLATLLVEKGEKVEIETDYNNPKSYTVKGSKGSLLVKELNDKALKVTTSFDSLVNIIQKAENTPEYDEVYKITAAAMGTLFTKYKQDLIRFVITNNKSLAAYMAMYQKLPNGFAMFGKENDLIYFKTLADSLATVYPKSRYVNKLLNDYTELSNTMAMRDMLNNAQEVSGAPDIVLPDVNGYDKKLSDLRGKVVLLDFWASHDKGLLMNNMETKEIYDKYKSKGFEVYQVSLDIDKNMWLDAIKNQGLDWISVCDFKGVNTLPIKTYNVVQVPTNFLIGKDGDILARDIYGKDLDAAIVKALSTK